MVLLSIIACLPKAERPTEAMRGNGDYGIKAFSILFEKNLLFTFYFIIFSFINNKNKI